MIRLEAVARSAQDQKEAALASADMRQQDIDRLHEELRARNDRLNEAAKREAALHADLAAARAEARPLTFELQAVKQERDSFAQRFAWYESELETRQAALLEARKGGAHDKVSARLLCTGWNG